MRVVRIYFNSCFHGSLRRFYIRRRKYYFKSCYSFRWNSCGKQIFHRKFSGICSCNSRYSCEYKIYFAAVFYCKNMRFIRADFYISEFCIFRKIGCVISVFYQNFFSKNINFRFCRTFAGCY